MLDIFTDTYHSVVNNVSPLAIAIYTHMQLLPPFMAQWIDHVGCVLDSLSFISPIYSYFDLVFSMHDPDACRFTWPKGAQQYWPLRHATIHQ